MKALSPFSFSLLLVCTSCNSPAEQSSDEETSEPNVVYVTNYPLYYYVQQIGGDVLDIHFPMGVSDDPAFWKPVQDTISAMQQADLIFLNGATYEQWLMNVTLPASITVNTSESFERQLLESGETFTHSHGDEGVHEHKGTAFTTWLDLSLAAEQAEAVKNALIMKWPEMAASFDANYQELYEELTGLHDAFKEVSTSDTNVQVAFSHPIYQYFQHAYGVKGTSLHWEPDQEMNHDMIHEMEHLAKDYGIRHMVWEATPLQSSIEKLQDMNIQSIVISQAGNRPKEGDFLTVMTSNLESIKEVYGMENLTTANE